MDSTIHTVGAVAAAYGVVTVSNRLGLETQPIILILSAAAGGLIPDLDHPKSKFGKATRPVSDIIFAAVGHRTLTHSLLFTLILSFLGWVFSTSVGLGLLIGMLSHIVLDLLTPMTNGVAFLYPFNKKRIHLWILNPKRNT